MMRMNLLGGILFAIAGCSSGANGGGDGGGGPAPPVKVSGIVSDYRTKMGVSGMQVCLYQPMLTPQPCATTAADGSYMVSGIPANTEVAASLTGPNYFSSLYAGTTTATDATVNIVAISSGTVVLLTAALSQQIDTTKGQIAFAVLDGNAVDGGTSTANAGVTVAMNPSSGNGPFYFDKNGIPQSMGSLSMTTANGAGAWLNANPGTVELTFTAPAGVTCGAPIRGWAGSTANSIKLPLVAGFGTAASVTCK